MLFKNVKRFINIEEAGECVVSYLRCLPFSKETGVIVCMIYDICFVFFIR